MIKPSTPTAQPRRPSSRNCTRGAWPGCRSAVAPISGRRRRWQGCNHSLPPPSRRRPSSGTGPPEARCRRSSARGPSAVAAIGGGENDAIRAHRPAPPSIGQEVEPKADRAPQLGALAHVRRTGPPAAARSRRRRSCAGRSRNRRPPSRLRRRAEEDIVQVGGRPRWWRRDRLAGCQDHADHCSEGGQRRWHRFLHFPSQGSRPIGGSAGGLAPALTSCPEAHKNGPASPDCTRKVGALKLCGGEQAPCTLDCRLNGLLGSDYWYPSPQASNKMGDRGGRWMTDAGTRAHASEPVPTTAMLIQDRRSSPRSRRSNPQSAHPLSGQRSKRWLLF